MLLEAAGMVNTILMLSRLLFLFKGDLRRSVTRAAVTGMATLLVGNIVLWIIKKKRFERIDRMLGSGGIVGCIEAVYPVVVLLGNNYWVTMIHGSASLGVVTCYSIDSFPTGVIVKPGEIIVRDEYKVGVVSKGVPLALYTSVFPELSYSELLVAVRQLLTALPASPDACVVTHDKPFTLSTLGEQNETVSVPSLLCCISLLASQKPDLDLSLLSESVPQPFVSFVKELSEKGSLPGEAKRLRGHAAFKNLPLI